MNVPSPLHDSIVVYLYERAIKGLVPVYFAAVPLQLVRRFDPNFDPRRHKAGRAAVDQIMSQWRQGQFSPAWVYERGDGYVLSDDYGTWAAADEGQPDFLPCWILGLPTLAGVEDVQGPIEVAEVADLLGIES